MNTDYNNSIRGIMFMVMHALSVSIIFTCIKYLTQFFRSAELVFFYKFMLFLVSLCWIIAKGFRCLAVPELKWIMLRGFLSSIASISFMYALKYVDMVNASALAYLEQVIWVILGILYFQERLNLIKFILITMSFSGAIIILIPDIFNKFYSMIGFRSGISENSFNPYYIFVMLAVVCWGTNAGIIKRLSKTVKMEVQLFYTMLFASALSFCIAYVRWSEISGFTIPYPIGFYEIDKNIFKFEYFQYLILTTFCYFIHSIGFFYAVKNAQFAVVMPFDYLRLIFSGILSYLVLNTVPEFNSYVGYFLILSSSVILTQLEYKKHK